MELNFEWFRYVAIMFAILVGFTGLKIAECEPFTKGGEKFSFKILTTGFAKHLIVILALSVTYIASDMFGADLAVIEINGTQLTLQAALNISMLAMITIYGSKLIRNFTQYAKVDNVVNDVKEIDVLPQSQPLIVDLEEDLDEEAQG